MDGQMPSMESGDVLGHEFMGEVVETGSPGHRLKVADRIVVPFNINCGECRQCKLGNWSCCLRSNRNGEMAAKMFGYPTAGLFGYSHLTGGYWGGQAEYVRVPMADVGPMKLPDGMSDEQALFLSDILPTGWQAAEHADIQPGDTVAIWGAGPVGLFAIRAAVIMGAERVVSIDDIAVRMDMARRAGATDVIDFTQENVLDRLKEITKGQGPGRRHRLRGDGGACGARDGEHHQHRAGKADGDAKALCARGDDHRGAPLRHRLGAGRLWRPGPGEYGFGGAEGS